MYIHAHVHQHITRHWRPNIEVEHSSSVVSSDIGLPSAEVTQDLLLWADQHIRRER